MWIDTHCHLDDERFAPDRDAMRERARTAGVQRCVIPAVAPANFAKVQALAQRWGDAYAVGIHPLLVPQADDADLHALDEFLKKNARDPHLVAVGEIGLDYFVPELKTQTMRRKQEHIYREQLKLARDHNLPVLLHVRRSVDWVLKGLRQISGLSGIAHAFNGSRQQADIFIDMGFKLGFGGTLTFDRATRVRALAAELPSSAIVMETDAPDIPPYWIYQTAAKRDAGAEQGRNEPAELPRIGCELAQLRNVAAEQWAQITTTNALAALPRLAALATDAVDNDAL